MGGSRGSSGKWQPWRSKPRRVRFWPTITGLPREPIGLRTEKTSLVDAVGTPGVHGHVEGYSPVGEQGLKHPIRVQFFGLEQVAVKLTMIQDLLEQIPKGRSREAGSGCLFGPGPFPAAWRWAIKVKRWYPRIKSGHDQMN